MSLSREFSRRNEGRPKDLRDVDRPAAGHNLKCIQRSGKRSVWKRRTWERVFGVFLALGSLAGIYGYATVFEEIRAESPILVWVGLAFVVGVLGLAVLGGLGLVLEDARVTIDRSAGTVHIRRSRARPGCGDVRIRNDQVVALKRCSIQSSSGGYDEGPSWWDAVIVEMRNGELISVGVDCGNEFWEDVVRALDGPDAPLVDPEPPVSARDARRSI